MKLSVRTLLAGHLLLVGMGTAACANDSDPVLPPLAEDSSTAGGPWTPTKAVFSQYQAIPNFDTAEHTVDDAPRLEALAQVLKAHHWTPQWRRESQDCPGGRTTELEMSFDNADDARIELGGCEESEFESDIDDLVRSWH